MSRFLLLISTGLFALSISRPVEAIELGMGLRVGEVTQQSAVIWTRITRDRDRHPDGYRDPSKREPKSDELPPEPVPVSEREGEMVGQAGLVRLVYAANADFSGSVATPWSAVDAAGDFVHQFELKYLQPATKYFIRVEAKESSTSTDVVTATGSFGTPQTAQRWQDVSFGVVTGQSYWDLDHKQGYHIYPAMQELALDFLVPTGDTVYYDSESPRARTVALARHHWHRMYSLPRHIEFHKHVPGYWEVDDHDSYANDGWPTINAKWMQPLTFEEGFAVFREQVPLGSHPTHRTIRWGQGLQIWLVEGRLYRSPNKIPDGPEKTIWGQEQLAWLQKSILESDADFKVLISPTPIVGPDRGNKADNHANEAFAHEGNLFRNWMAEHNLRNFFVCCGDRHWQYYSIDPDTKLREYSCGPASDIHAGGTPGQDFAVQPYHRVKGGFLTVNVSRTDGQPTIAFRHHDVHGKVVHESVQIGRGE